MKVNEREKYYNCELKASIGLEKEVPQYVLFQNFKY